MTDLFQQNNTMQYFQDRGIEERQNQIDIINKIVSPEFIENEKKKGKVTAFETLSNAKKWGYAVPYIGTGADISNSFKIKGLQEKVKNGIQLTNDEMETYKEFVLDIASQSARGQTIPSMAFDSFMQSIPYMVEFGVGLATSAEGVGFASLGSTGTKLAVKNAIKQGVVKTTKEAVKKQLAKTTATTLLKDSTIGVAKFNAKYLPQQGIKRYGELEIDNNLFVTPEGQVLLNEAESKPATSVLKAMGLMQIETLSETAGYAFNFGGRVVSNYINKKILQKMPDKFVKNLNALTKQVTGFSTVKALEKYGWNGILEEFGEERVSDFLQTTFDLDDEKGYSFEQFLQALFPPKEQAMAEILSFALMGGTGAGIKHSIDYSRYKKIAGDIQEQSRNEDGSYNIEKIKRLLKKHKPNITEENLNKAVNSITKGITKTQDYSVDDFLLDCGVFRLSARKSNTDERLTKILQENGVREEDIEEFIDYASLDDKAQLLKMHNEATVEKTVDYSALKNDLKNAGHSEEQAELEVQSLNKIDEILMNKYNAEGEAENLIKNRNLKIQSLQNEIQKKKEEEYIEKSDLKQKEIHHFKPSELKTNAKIFQYKENSDIEGVTDRLNGVEEWSAKDSGIVIVYETKDGTRYIVDGHQRLALAKRLNDDKIRLDGLLYREVDGYTPSDIRLEGAKKNIAEGSGTPIDTAKIIRELGGIENYPASLPRTGVMYEYGYALSRLGEEAFEKVVNRYVTPAQGAMVANIIRTDHNKQSLAIDIISKEGIETLSETELMARQVLSMPTESVQQTNLFGAQDVLQSCAVEKIKIIDGALKRLKKSKNLMAHLANNSRDIENNGNKLNKENNEKLKISAETAFEVIKKQAFYKGVISDKAGELAQKYKNGDISYNQAVLDFCDFCMQDNIINIIFNGEQKENSANEAEKSETKEENNKQTSEDDEQIDNGQTSLFGTSEENIVAKEELNNELPEFKPEKKPEKLDKYEDFGEKIEGAKKDLWQSYKKSFDNDIEEDFDKISLVKEFPEPNYELLIREGIDVNMLATIKALRDMIPTKPRGRYGTYKRKQYVEVLTTMKKLAGDLINGRMKLEDFNKHFEKDSVLKNRVDLYVQVGYPAFKNVKEYKILDDVSIFYDENHNKLDEPKKGFAVAKGYSIIKTFNDYQNALDYLRGILSIMPEAQGERKTNLDIYQMRKTGEIIIGKKVGSGKYIDLKGGFTNAKEARAYYREHEAELLEKLKKLKEAPETRGSANKDRIGDDYREGANVTPEKFANEFGFRGVQFGNYVEQGKRVNDINEAYDALLDLANLLDVPSRALSLNGSLGIAFGARGSGGKNPAKAHYEPDEVVINLTKKKGAGSLAHEWWHALDNYFAKGEGKKLGYFSEMYSSKEVRKEVFGAYKDIVKVLKNTMFERAEKIDLTRTKDYWSTTVEMTARGFEAYIIAKAKLKGFRNDYLANILTEEEYHDIDSYPYPLNTELEDVIKVYDNLFSVLKTKESEKGISFYQSAYHGTPHRFDEFSTDNIGTGEGVQAHGWGLYFAENKEISEEYRNRLIGTAFDMKNSTYNNTPLEDMEFGFLSSKGRDILYKAIKENKSRQYIINYLKEQINKYKNTMYSYEYESDLGVFELWNGKIEDIKLEENKGQLFKVDIPEADEMLDEQKTIDEQPEKVQKAINNIIIFLYKNQYRYGNISNISSILDTLHKGKTKVQGKYEITGGMIYKEISDILGSSKNASLMLNNRGVKGISYNGGRDGRCYVVFDDKAVDVIETYYQPIANKTIKKAQEVKKALQKIADGSEEETVKDLRDDLEQFGGSNDVTFIFGDDKKGIRHIAQRHGIKALLGVFDSVIDGKITKFVKGKQTVHIEKNGFEAVLSLNENGNKKTWLLTGWDSKISPDEERQFRANLNSTQESPTFSRQNLGAGLKDIITYNDYNLNPDSLEQSDENGFRGKTTFSANETIVELAQGHDSSTFMHELAHIYLHDLQELAKTNKRAEKDLEELYDKFEFNSSNYTEAEFIDLHERFARSFEAYLLNGESPSARMKTVFEKFKEFLREVYNSLEDLNVEFSSEIKQCFDRLFTTDEEYENEVLPMYQQNEELADSINKQETLAYKIKNNINNITDMWKSFYDTVIMPIDTRLGKISPELKQILRKHTFDLSYQSKKDCDKITPFLLKIKEIKDSKKMIEFNKTQFNAYNLLSYALNNRDSYTVNRVVKILGIEAEFESVRELLDELHDETTAIGLEVGYLESYYPRMVKTDKTEAFIDLFEKMAREEEIDLKNQLLELDEAQYSDVKRTIKDNDIHGLWNSADKAKLINTTIRGFGKNNIMLSRIGQLKFERLIDKLTPQQQRFYEPIEKALSNYVIGARKNIEERKFFGAENKEVGKLRATIKRKRETLREVKTRTPAQAKWKELNRLKYELAPIEIKLETISGELKNNLKRREDVRDISAIDSEEKKKLDDYIKNQKETIKKLSQQTDRLKSQIEWVEKNNALKVKYTVIKRMNTELSNLSKEIEKILGDVNHVEDSIGRLIADLAEKNIIHVKDERIIRDLLVSRFNTLRLEKFALSVRDTSTIVTLNDITNAVTQITDLSFSAFKFGLFNTIQGARNIENLTREDLGINNIAEEFRGSSGLSNWLNKQLKIIGLDLIDGFAKNVAINASVISARKKAKKNDKKFMEKLKFLFDKKAPKVKQDLIDGKITDEIIYIAFNDLADIQPISADQMTRGYQSGFKPLYVLKTYSIKALDIVRNECFMKITSGIKAMKEKKAEGRELIAEGLGNIIRLQIFMWLFGVPQDLLKDLIANRDFDIPEHFIDNLLIFGIFNRFLVGKISENPANIWLENVKLPALQAFGDLVSGIQKVQKGKQEVKDMYVWSRVPIVGKLYYNWLGGRKKKRVELFN